MTNRISKDEFLSWLHEEMEDMSGLIWFKVQTTWANSGKRGEKSDLVLARNALQALEISWLPEDPQDLRTVSIEWLCPFECTLGNRNKKK